MGNSFVLFDVSIVISHGQFHCGNRGHTQNTDFPWVKSHFPVGKRSSGTTAIDLSFSRVLPNVSLLAGYHGTHTGVSFKMNKRRPY